MTEFPADLRVLVADDNVNTRTMILEMLRAMNIRRAHAAEDGAQAWTAIQHVTQPFDLIICDWQMPHLTGLDLLRLLRSTDPDVPFLMVTGKGDIQSVVEAKLTGVSGFIVKPFSAAQLEIKMRVLLARHPRQPDVAA